MFGMIKSLGGDLAGTSDNCAPIRRDDATSAGDLLSFLTPHEKPWIILKSKIKEFIFTDIAFVYLERDNAAGTKRIVTRFPYRGFVFSRVRFETPGMGMTDLACEIKFVLAGQEWSIDVVKSEMDTAKSYYQCLVQLAAAQERNALVGSAAQAMYHRVLLQDGNQLSGVLSLAEELVNKTAPESYGAVFEAHFASAR